MAIVYGYFKSDEDARRAAQHCQELGISSDMVIQPDFPSYIRERPRPLSAKMLRRRVWKISLYVTALVAIFGAVVATVLPALWGNTVIAGPLLMALYGIAVGLTVAATYDLRRGDDVVPEEIAKHVLAHSVLIVHTSDMKPTNVEHLLEADGALEVVHRAA